MSIDTLLSRLEGVRRRGDHQWMARCPAHDDHDPSLSVKVGTEDRLLVYCFGGCSPSDIMSAIGMSLSDLFPEDPHRHIRPAHIDTWSMLRALRHQLTKVQMAAHAIADGELLSDSDLESLRSAAEDIGVILNESIRRGSR